MIVGGLGHATGGRISLSIPPIVYAFTGGTGIAVATIMGCFPSWIPFFIVAVGIIISAIVYLVGIATGKIEVGGD